MGGGGGSSGSVDYPQYMKDHHKLALDGIQGFWDTESPAFLDNPFDTDYVFDPTAKLAQMSTWAGRLEGELATFQTTTNFAGISLWALNWLNDMRDSSTIDTVVDSFSTRLDEDINSNVIPKFQAGMRDINAVQSSAFAIGESLIWRNRDNAVAAFESELRMKNEFEFGLQTIQVAMQAYALELNAAATKLEYVKQGTHLQVDTGRLDILANKESADGKIEEREAKARWRPEVYTYTGNMLAAIGSASVQTMGKRNKAASAMGGALSGAAVGTSVGSSVAAGTSTGASAGGYWGAAIGAVVGLAAGLLSD